MSKTKQANGLHWIDRENKINEDYGELVVTLLENEGYQILGEVEIQESDYDFQWELCDILYDETHSIRIGIIGTGYLFDPDRESICLRDEF